MRGIVDTLHELTERGVTVRSLHDGDGHLNQYQADGGRNPDIDRAITSVSWSASAPRSSWSTPADRARKFGSVRQAQLRAGHVRPADEGQRRDRRHDPHDARNKSDHAVPVFGGERRD